MNIILSFFSGIFDFCSFNRWWFKLFLFFLYFFLTLSFRGNNLLGFYFHKWLFLHTLSKIFFILIFFFLLPFSSFTISIKLQYHFNNFLHQSTTSHSWINFIVQLNFNQQSFYFYFSILVPFASAITPERLRFIFCSCLDSATVKILLRFCCLNSLTLRYLDYFLWALT